MDVEEESERCPQTNVKKQRKTLINEIPHKAYLEECFRRQIGLPIDKSQRIDIFSYTDRRIAKGYQQIVTTCQGMYYEIREEDWEHWNGKRLTIGGDWCC